jgi:predicted DNA binding CopG/RHH family protein
MNEISNWSDVPEFDSDEEENQFWAKTSLNPRLINASVHSPDSRESTTITLRFDPRMLSRVKRIARSRFLNYQSMMKQWLAERMEEEMRRSGDHD